MPRTRHAGAMLRTRGLHWAVPYSRQPTLRGSWKRSVEVGALPPRRLRVRAPRPYPASATRDAGTRVAPSTPSPPAMPFCATEIGST
jgi:hypothetical protein